MAEHPCDWCTHDEHNMCSGAALHPDDGGLTWCDCDDEADHG